MVKVYWTGWAHYCEFVCPDVSWLKASMSECIREAIIFRVLRMRWLSDWRSAMVEVTIWSQIWNAMAFDCFNRTGKSVWCKKVYWESIGLCGLSVCQWCIWKRRQCGKGHRVPVDHLHQVCVCVCVMSDFVVWMVGVLSVCDGVSGAKAFGNGNMQKITRFCFWV